MTGINNEKLKRVIATRQSRYLLYMQMYLENPDKTMVEKGIETYRELLNDAHVYSCIQSRLSGVLKMKWDVKGNEQNAMETAFIKEVLDKYNFRRIIREMLEAPLYGYKPMEILYQYVNGRIVPIDLIGKPSEWFRFNQLNQCLFLSAKNSMGELLPPRKFLIVQHNPDYQNPYGESLLTKCYYPVMFKKGGMEFWVTFTEKYGMPFLWAFIGSSATNKEVDEMVEQLDDMMQDNIAVFPLEPEDANVQLTEAAKSSSAEIYERLLHFCNAEISKAILSQTLTTEQGETGAYAMSQTHLEVRDDVIESDKHLVEFYINELIRWTVEINFGIEVEPPVFELYSEKDVDMTLAQRDQALASTGQIRFTKEYFMNAYGFKKNEIEIVEPSATEPGGLPMPGEPPQNVLPIAATVPEDEETEFAEDEPGGELEANQTAVDNVTAIGLEDFTRVSRKLLDKAVAVIEQSETYEEATERLVKVFPDLDTEEIEEFIAGAMLKFHMGGMLTEKGKSGK